MATPKKVVDISRWQGLITPAIADAFEAQEVEGVIMKLGQGTNWEDPQWRNSYEVLKRFKRGGYFFVTLDDAKKQRDWAVHLFSEAIWDYIPDLDCEGQTVIGGHAYGISEIMAHPYEFQKAAAYTELYQLGQDLKMSVMISPDQDQLALYSLFSLSYPSQENVSVISSGVRSWMATQPQYDEVTHLPGIYTNKASGDIIFTWPSWAEWNLHVANWTEALAPAEPYVWSKAKKLYWLWQRRVERNGTKYGLPPGTGIDINEWGLTLPWPGGIVPPPPPHPEKTKIITIQEADNSIWSGVVKRIE